jgi:Ca2+/H+ antiporter
MLREMSTLHVILLCYSVVLTIVEWLRLDRADTLLSISLGVVKLAVVVDCIFVVTHYLTRLSTSHRMLGIILYQTPFVTGPLFEFELTRLMLKDNATAAANTFLVGCVYVKPLVAGALCLGLHGLHTGRPRMQLQATNLFHVSEFFLRSGLLLMVYAYGFGFQSLPMPAAVAGNSPWLSHGVPLLFILSVGLTYYFWFWHAERRRVIVSDKSNAFHGSEWVLLLVGLVLLKVVAAHLMHSVWKQMQGAAWTDQDSTWNGSGAVVPFVVLPLAVSVVDHLADISAAYREDMGWSWPSLCQSTLQTFLLIRPLFTLVGHDLDPRSGCIGIALCFLGIALWLSLPAISRKFSLHSMRNRVADIHRTAQRIGSPSGLLGHVDCLCSPS